MTKITNSLFTATPPQHHIKLSNQKNASIPTLPQDSHVVVKIARVVKDYFCGAFFGAISTLLIQVIFRRSQKGNFDESQKGNFDESLIIQMLTGALSSIAARHIFQPNINNTGKVISVAVLILVNSGIGKLICKTNGFKDGIFGSIAGLLLPIYNATKITSPQS